MSSMKTAWRTMFAQIHRHVHTYIQQAYLFNSSNTDTHIGTCKRTARSGFIPYKEMSAQRTQSGMDIKDMNYLVGQKIDAKVISVGDQSVQKSNARAQC